MKHPYILMSCVLALTVFSTLYDERNSDPTVATRSISSVDLTKDGLCVEKDSEWGKDPAPLTKESICKCHPDQCSKEEKEELVDTGKSYSVEVRPGN